MWWLALISGLWLGLGSSGHCLGMCGPIAISLPFRNEWGRMRWGAYSIYQIGRLMTYVSIGLIVGLAGQAITWKGFGNVLSIVSGLFLLVLAFNHLNWNRKKSFPALHAWIGRVWNKTFLSGSLVAFLVAGAANGLLPCGMVYAAAIAALGTADTTQSVSVMAGFGLGTLPVFFLLPLFSKVVSKFPSFWRYFVPAALAITGIWLIVRGMPFFFPVEHCPPSDPNFMMPLCNDGV